MLETRFARTLSNDRIAPVIFTAAGMQYSNIKPSERSQVLAASAKIFVHRFLDTFDDSLLVFSLSRAAPVKIDSWILAGASAVFEKLPESASAANAVSRTVANSYKLINSDGWTVCSSGDEIFIGNLNPAKRKVLETMDGWSLCLPNEALPSDSGSCLKTLATQIFQEASAAKQRKKRPGRPNQVIPMVERLKKQYPNGVPNKPLKVITRELACIAPVDCSETVMRQAIAKYKVLNINELCHVNCEN